MSGSEVGRYICVAQACGVWRELIEQFLKCTDAENVLRVLVAVTCNREKFHFKHVYQKVFLYTVGEKCSSSHLADTSIPFTWVLEHNKQ